MASKEVLVRRLRKSLQGADPVIPVAPAVYGNSSGLTLHAVVGDLVVNTVTGSADGATCIGVIREPVRLSYRNCGYSTQSIGYGKSILISRRRDVVGKGRPIAVAILDTVNSRDG